jgi:hypothetical protein
MHDKFLNPLLERYILPLAAALYASAGSPSLAGGTDGGLLLDSGPRKGLTLHNETSGGISLDSRSSGGILLDSELQLSVPQPISSVGGGGRVEAEVGSWAGGARRKHAHTPGVSTLDHSRSFTVSYEVHHSVL